MKQIVLFVVAGLFLICSIPLFTQGNIAAGICGVVAAGVCGFIGYRMKAKKTKANENLPFNVRYSDGEIRVSEAPFENNNLEINYDNEVAAAIVLSVLEDNGIDVSKLSHESTADYLKIITSDMYKLCFCRLKLSGQSHYMELTISAKDGKTLANDPRFTGIDVAKKRFTRIPLSGMDEIRDYADVICLAYVWGTTVG